MHALHCLRVDEAHVDTVSVRDDTGSDGRDALHNIHLVGYACRRAARPL